MPNPPKQERPSSAPVSDPHYAREAAKYENPTASRELILHLLGEAKQPLAHSQICQQLALQDEAQIEALRRRLHAMERDGQLLVNRKGAYGLVDKLDLVRGRVQGHRDGYGFLLPQDGSDHLYLSARQMALVFDGDELLARVSGVDARGRRAGKVVEVLQRGCSEIVGRYYEESGIGAVIPDNARINHDVLIPSGQQQGARHGQIVVAEITRWPTRQLGTKGRITEVLGEHLDPGLEIDVAVRSHGIPHVWPEDVLREAAGFEQEPGAADKQARIDLRDRPFVTIDGEDAQDFDDAVYCEETRTGDWCLWVAIADVSHYVRPGSALDREAAERGNSVYFPGRVVPMLPEALSNGLCSLKPGVDRLAMICEIHIGQDGQLKQYRFYEGVIHSHARLTYSQVGELLEHGKQDAVTRQIAPQLQRLHSLYKLLRAARETRGAIDFDTAETRILFDAQRKIDAIVPLQRNAAHKLIEECMLCANVATAAFFKEHRLPILYRVHDGPGAEKLENLRGFLGELGLELGGGQKPLPLDYQKLLASVVERADAHVIQTVLLRSMSRAVYQPDNQGHFGLNYEAYTHFTSPIRRYPDLLAHRGIRRVIRSTVSSRHVRRSTGEPIPAKHIFPYDAAAMVSLGERCSMTERRADEATREVDSWLKCEYLQDHVGDTFEGVVAAVTVFGLFIELAGVYIDGLVHISALPSDYYHFDRSRMRLTGERGGRSFNLGDAATVQIARVDLDNRKIDLELLSSRSRLGAKRAGIDAGRTAKKTGKRKTRRGGKDKAKRTGKDTGRADKNKTRRRR